MPPEENHLTNWRTITFRCTVNSPNHNFPQIESGAKILRDRIKHQMAALTFKTLAMAMAASQIISGKMWRDKEYNS